MDRNRTNQIIILKDLFDRAIKIHGYETGFFGVDELPLNDEIILDTCNEAGNISAYAITRDKVIATAGASKTFEELDLDDIYTLQDIIRDEYEID